MNFGKMRELKNKRRILFVDDDPLVHDSFSMWLSMANYYEPGKEPNGKEDYDFFISTGTPEEEIKIILEIKGLSKYFREVHGSPGKKPDHVKGILERFGYDKSEVVFIGDAPTDIEAARKNGITFIGRYTTSELIKSEKNQIKDFSSFNEFLETL